MIRDAIDPGCRRCRLHMGRTQVVTGTGAQSSRLVFIGEAPGRDEDLQGEPFVGRAGMVLNSALASAGVTRDDVYITNLVKCRPPDNRKPRKDEVSACSMHLESEFSHLRPSVVCLLGQSVAKGILDEDRSMAELAGTERTVTLWGHDVRAFISYHPAACLYTRENVDKFDETIRICVEAAGLSRR